MNKCVLIGKLFDKYIMSYELFEINKISLFV